MNPLVGPSERAVRHSTSAIGAFFALSVADIDASVKWYSEKLEMKVTMREPNTNGAAVAVLEGDGLIVELIQHDSARPLTTAAPAAKESLYIHGVFKVGVIVSDFEKNARKRHRTRQCREPDSVLW